MNACRQPTDVLTSAIDPGWRGVWHTAEREAAKQHRSGITFDFLIRAFNSPSWNVGFVDQGYDRRAICMTPWYSRQGALLRSMPSTIGLVVGVGHGKSSCAASNSSCVTALRRDRSARGASGAAKGRTRPEVLPTTSFTARLVGSPCAA